MSALRDKTVAAAIRRRMAPMVGLTLLGASFLTSAPIAHADDVFLENGNSFEGVIVVQETDKSVKIRLAYGDLSLPRSWIARIDRAESPLETYLERREALLASPAAKAGDWLELARWVRPRDLSHGYKEALLEAALLDPLEPGLAPLLHGIGYVLERESGLWVSVAELRRAEAAVAAEVARRQAAAQRAQLVQSRRETGHGETTEETLSRAVEALARAELEREERASDRGSRRERTFYPVQVGRYYGASYPIAFFPGFAAPPVEVDPAAAASPPADPYASVRRRLPGSLLGARPGSRRISSRSRAPVPRQPGALPLGNRP